VLGVLGVVGWVSGWGGLCWGMRGGGEKNRGGRGGIFRNSLGLGRVIGDGKGGEGYRGGRGGLEVVWRRCVYGGVRA